uniref:Ovule protein n=1 Tax=Brugia timori TaxID=42155 RepID=A0A0R3QF62_9BILA
LNNTMYQRNGEQEKIVPSKERNCSTSLYNSTFTSRSKGTKETLLLCKVIKVFSPLQPQHNKMLWHYLTLDHNSPSLPKNYHVNRNSNYDNNSIWYEGTEIMSHCSHTTKCANYRKRNHTITSKYN